MTPDARRGGIDSVAIRAAHDIGVETFSALDLHSAVTRASPLERDLAPAPEDVRRAPEDARRAPEDVRPVDRRRTPDVRDGALDPLQQLIAWASPLEGARALEIGCGDGELGATLAAAGAQVTAVDQDPALIAGARRRIARARLGDRMTAQVMPLHTLDFPDDGFDLVVGRAALDRADLDACRRELARVLRPGGAAVLIEPVCLSPTLRALALAARRPPAPPPGPLAARPFHEHHLQRFLDGFEGAERAYFHLTGRVAGRLFPQLAGALSRWDRRILDRFPSTRCLAAICVLRARKPAPRGAPSGMTAWC